MVRGAALVALALIASAVPSRAATPTIEDLVTLTDLSSLAISPDGKTAVFRTERASVADDDYQLDWYAVSVDGKDVAHRVAGAGGALWHDAGTLRDARPQWSPDSHWFYYRALVDGQVQVWRTSRDGRRSEQITHDPANVDAFALTPDGSRLIYRVGATREAIVRAERREYDDGIRIDASVDVAANLYRSAWIDGRHATQRLTGFWFTRAGLLADAPKHFRAIDLASLHPVAVATGDRALVGDPPKPFEMVGGRYLYARATSRDGETVSVLADGTASLLSVTLADGGPANECTAALCRGRSIVAVAWRPGANTVIFTVADDLGAQSLLEWDPVSGRVRRIVAASGLLNGGRDPNSSCAIAAQSAVCVAAAAGSPPQLERVDLASGARTTLFAPNAAIADNPLPVEPLVWHDAEGERFTGQLFLPTKDAVARAPLFVTYYSCDGYLRGGTGDEWPLAPLAAHGIAALCINRAPVAPGYADEFETYRVALRAVQSAVATLDARGLIEPKHVGMGGLSFGSEVTMWIASHSSLLAAASITSTLLEPSYYWFNGVKGRDTHDVLKRSWGLGAPDETPDRWREVSPAMNVASIHAPLLMQMPEQEFRLNMELFAKLSHSTTPVDLYAFPDEPHIKIQPRHKLAAYTRNLDWFRFWLQHVVDPDPTKAAQYRRWEAMRQAQR